MARVPCKAKAYPTRSPRFIIRYGPHLRIDVGGEGLPVAPLHRNAEVKFLGRRLRQQLPQVAVEPDEAAPQRPQNGLAAQEE